MSELAVGSIAGLASNSFVVDVAAGSTLDLSSGATLPAGSVLQVVSTTKTDTFTSTSTSFVPVTGLTAAITPSSTSNKILIMLSFAYGIDASNEALAFNITRDGTAIAQPDAGGVAEASFSAYPESAVARNSASITFLDSPATASSVTYGLECNLSDAIDRMWIGRGSGDVRSISTITVMEIAG